MWCLFWVACMGSQHNDLLKITTAARCQRPPLVHSLRAQEGPLNQDSHLAPQNQYKAVTGFQHRPCMHTEIMVPCYLMDILLVSLSSRLANRAPLTLHEGSASSFNTFPKKHITGSLSHTGSESSEEHKLKWSSQKSLPIWTVGFIPLLLSPFCARRAAGSLALCSLCRRAHCELLYVLIMLNMCTFSIIRRYINKLWYINKL